jgi:hypothetical protein
MFSGGKKECPNCAVQIPRGSKVCYVCGYEFPQGKGKTFPLIALILIILFLLPLIKFLISLFK